MKRYTVTIAPESAVGKDDEATPQMVCRIEVADGEAHVVELTMKAHKGSDLTVGKLPYVDLARLAGAFVPEAEASVPFLPHAPEPVAHEAPVRSASRAKPSPAGPVPRARAYRKMPDPEELWRVYSEMGSIANTAKHYNVPVHTAQGWIGRLRRRGVTPSE